MAVLPEQLGQPEICDLHPAALVDEDVFRLDVAMDDAFVVGELQGVADLRHDRQGLLGLYVAGPDRLPQVDAVDVLHDEVELAVRRAAEIVDGDDVRMAEPRQRPGLAREPLGKGRIAADLPAAGSSRPRGGPVPFAGPCRPRPCPPRPSSSMISSCGILAATSSTVGGTNPVPADDGGGWVAAVPGSAAGRLSRPASIKHFGQRPGRSAGGNFAAALRAKLRFAHSGILRDRRDGVGFSRFKTRLKPGLRSASTHY